MSQKSRRSRRQTTEDDIPLKPPTPKPNGTEEAPPSVVEEKPATPLPLPPQEPEEPQENAKEPETNRPPTPPEQLANGHEEELVKTEEEMEALIVSDEPDPELQFEETSDLESGRESPVISRCKTRRSLTRNIPTPKTPQSAEETPLEQKTLEPEEPVEEETQEDMNQTFESCSEDVSTKAQVGGDSTRLNYTEGESNSFLQTAKSKTFGETLRHLSTRRTIRPISVEFRRKLNEKGGKISGVEFRESMERVVGVKRKNGGGDEEDFAKRFKNDSPGFFARFTSPLASIRGTFKADLISSTPKLTGYKDEKCMLENENSKISEVKDGERRWCSIM